MESPIFYENFDRTLIGYYIFIIYICTHYRLYYTIGYYTLYICIHQELPQVKRPRSNKRFSSYIESTITFLEELGFDFRLGLKSAYGFWSSDQITYAYITSE